LEKIQDRTKRFALEIIKFANGFPRNMTAYVLGKQIIRSATSVGANYRAAQRARSRSEFIAKLGIVLEEADETVYWLEMITESALVSAERSAPLLKEANEITAIIVSSLKTAKAK
jgi:four helix bundle protein